MLCFVPQARDMRYIHLGHGSRSQERKGLAAIFTTRRLFSSLYQKPYVKPLLGIGVELRLREDGSTP